MHLILKIELYCGPVVYFQKFSGEGFKIILKYINIGYNLIAVPVLGEKLGTCNYQGWF